MSDNAKVYLKCLQIALMNAMQTCERISNDPAGYAIEEVEMNIFPTLQNILANAYNVCGQMVRRVLPGLKPADSSPDGQGIGVNAKGEVESTSSTPGKTPDVPSH